MPVEKLWRNPVPSHLRCLYTGEFQKMFFYRHLGLGQAERLSLLVSGGKGKEEVSASRLLGDRS
jgi:hypothetical protein